MRRRTQVIVGGLAALAVGGTLIAELQLPFPGNPPVVMEPQWDSPETRELAARACFDCHSNETKWPWYASVPPFRWLVRDHVWEGREVLNFSEWNRDFEEAEEAAEVVEEGEMPLANYLWLHPEANLAEADKAALIAGLDRTVKGVQPVPSSGEAEEEFEHQEVIEAEQD
jgi:Haem-binding domain